MQVDIGSNDQYVKSVINNSFYCKMRRFVPSPWRQVRNFTNLDNFGFLWYQVLQIEPYMTILGPTVQKLQGLPEPDCIRMIFFILLKLTVSANNYFGKRTVSTVGEQLLSCTLRKKCYKEVEPPYPLSFWHFPVLFDAEWPAQFNTTDCKMRSHFNLNFPARIYC